MRFRNTGQGWSVWETYNANKNWLLSSGDGTKTVEAEYRAALGNVFSRSDTVIPDTVEPSVASFAVDGGNEYSTTVSVSLSGSVTGATAMRFRNDSSAWSPWFSYSTTALWTLSSGDGTKTVHAEYRDTAGNVVAISDSIILDATAPEIGSFAINGGPRAPTPPPSR